MAETTIEWADHSVNPIRAKMKSGVTINGKFQRVAGHYCEKVSAGCANCYSSNMQKRFGMPRFGAGQYRDDVEIFLDESKLDEVRNRKKPTRYFWEDMSDLFGDWVKPEWIAKCFRAMDDTPQHTHMLLTKRPENIRRMWKMRASINIGVSDADHARAHNPRKNVWLGTSVENQEQADKRIPELLKCSDLCAKTFLSCEPLLGPVDLRGVMEPLSMGWVENIPTGPEGGSAINLVIIGGESGPNARPCNVEWMRSIVSQCQAADVACFVKQLGSNAFWYSNEDASCHEIPGMDQPSSVEPYTTKHKKGGDITEWPTDLQIREMP